MPSVHILPCSLVDGPLMQARAALEACGKSQEGTPGKGEPGGKAGGGMEDVCLPRPQLVGGRGMDWLVVDTGKPGRVRDLWGAREAVPL